MEDWAWAHHRVFGVLGACSRVLANADGHSVIAGTCDDFGGSASLAGAIDPASSLVRARGFLRTLPTSRTVAAALEGGTTA